MLEILFIISMFFAFAIGGEKGFGKGKRGLLLAMPMTAMALTVHLPLWAIILQPAILYGIYQALKYDQGVALVHYNADPMAKLEGWAIIAGNGALIGLTPAIMLLGGGHIWRILYSVVISALGFCFVVRLSNDARLKPYRDWLNKYMPNYPYLNFKDSWYISCGIMGAVLALITILLK